MMCSRHQRLLALAILVGGSGRAAAQNGLSILAQSIELPVGTARRQCAVIPYRKVFVGPPRSTACRVVRYVAIDTAAGSAWSSALYRRTSVYRFPGNVEPDTIVELEFVLFKARSRDASRVFAVAHARVDYSDFLDISAELATHGASSLFGVKFDPNNNGGGCQHQDLLQLHGSHWNELGDPTELVRAELTRRGILPGPVGTSLRQVSCLDVHTLHGTSGLFADTDAPHFPSRTVDFQLELTDQGLRLAALTVAHAEADQLKPLLGEAERVLDIPFVARHAPAGVAERGEKPLDLPTSSSTTLELISQTGERG